MMVSTISPSQILRQLFRGLTRTEPCKKFDGFALRTILQTVQDHLHTFQFIALSINLRLQVHLLFRFMLDIPSVSLLIGAVRVTA